MAGQWEEVVHNDAGCCMLFRRYQAEQQRTGCEYARLTCCIDLFYDQVFKLRLSELIVSNAKMDSGPFKLTVVTNLIFNTPHSKFGSKRLASR